MHGGQEKGCEGGHMEAKKKVVKVAKHQNA